MQTSDFLQIRWWYEKYCGLYDIHIQLAWVWDLFPKLFTPWCCYIHVHVQRFEPLTLQRFMRFQKKAGHYSQISNSKTPTLPRRLPSPQCFSLARVIAAWEQSHIGKKFRWKYIYQLSSKWFASRSTLCHLYMTQRPWDNLDYIKFKVNFRCYYWGK